MHLHHIKNVLCSVQTFRKALLSAAVCSWLYFGELSMGTVSVVVVVMGGERWGGV